MDACSTDARVTVQVQRRFNHSPQQVFDAWLNPAQARRFFFATPTGEMIRSEIDARVGGRFVFTDRRGDVDAEHVGEYLEIERPRHLAFDFAVELYEKNKTRVDIDMTPTSDGCELTLTHAIHPDWVEFKSQTEKGWRGMLDGLAETLQADR